jgi:hypothetical protein
MCQHRTHAKPFVAPRPVCMYSLKMTGKLTIGQALFGKAALYAVCQRCGHFGVLSFAQMNAFPSDTLVATIEKRFRCNVCKARGSTIQSDKPARGERTCPNCGQATWRDRPTAIPAGAKACKRCLQPVR